MSPLFRKRRNRTRPPIGQGQNTLFLTIMQRGRRGVWVVFTFEFPFTPAPKSWWLPFRACLPLNALAVGIQQLIGGVLIILGLDEALKGWRGRYSCWELRFSASKFRKPQTFPCAWVGCLLDLELNVGPRFHLPRCVKELNHAQRLSME